MQRQKQKFRNTLIALIVLVAAVCIIWIVMPGGDRNAEESAASGAGSGGSADSGDSAGSGGGGGGEDMVQAEDNGTSPEAEADPGPEMPWFYDKALAERYEAFAAESPWLAFEDVVWMVNVDLDKPPYEEVSDAADPLDKYALVNKHFALPADFSPPDLVPIGKSMMREQAASAMNEMIAAASKEGHYLWVQSGYRSYDLQASLYNQYSARDGSEAADTYSARPGHSEHQLGLAADFNTITSAFGDTPEGIWAAENCWKYGFIVRYTLENTDITLYKPEPWHMRYVGRDAAGAMLDRGIISFEEYWVKYANTDF